MKNICNSNTFHFVEFLPEWETLGWIAGYERNTLIIDEADCVIAFPVKGSFGSWDAVRKAWALDKQAVIVEREKK
ncbi:MAG: hypothetical protein LBL13_03960 [Bacteroidales bacterium]|nr:hypothetical protein [Bacteroidales bacterium]